MGIGNWELGNLGCGVFILFLVPTPYTLTPHLDCPLFKLAIIDFIFLYA
ncbi:MAG: hypothetical protein F6J93_05190 [Oscillatoria sp. SIO1A7]|nr:hypothetical protein [Oscillatoria sp. SIO1A7]